MEVIFLVFISAITLFFLAGAIISLTEGEYRASLLLFFGAVIFSGTSILINVLIPEPSNILIPLMIILTVILVLFFPNKRIVNKDNFPSDMPPFHEADAVLSRRKLIEGTHIFREYYQLHAEYKEADDKARANPGLLSKRSKFYDPILFSAAESAFILTEDLHALDEVPISPDKKDVDPVNISKFIVDWIKKSGAHSVGFAKLKSYHLYSHKGRGKRRGEEIVNDSPHAIAITSEMDYKNMRYAPKGPTVLESADQYLNTGTLATKLAIFIRQLGYQAKAHIDGNYEVICPLVAADAGLGVIGRMGLLMTPRLGPRVRIAVVTTDLPLTYASKQQDQSALQFCEWCKKCADVCPASAIPKGPKSIFNGSLRWKTNSEGCYNYWTISGTDCGQCVISCPYSHPDNWFHRFVRWGIKNNLLFRRIAINLDNALYGKKPKPRRLPNWLSDKKQG